MIRPYRMDLHIHTCLSPCGMSENVPTRVVAAALRRRLDAIGICDHNSSENVAPVRRAADSVAPPSLRVFGGIEITTREEVHLLSIFERDADLERMQRLLYDNLPGENDPDAFGEQYQVDHEDYVIGRNRHLLLGATTLGMDETVEHIHRFGGLAIASHIDRGSFSVISQLGFIPESVRFDALELSRRPGGHAGGIAGDGPAGPGAAQRAAAQVVVFSDAHRLEDIGSAYTIFRASGASVHELRLALLGAEGRSTEPVFG